LQKTLNHSEFRNDLLGKDRIQTNKLLNRYELMTGGKEYLLMVAASSNCGESLDFSVRLTYGDLKMTPSPEKV